MEQYNVTGMSCAACSARVEKAVSAVPGVESCAVNLLTGSMSVEGSASPETIIRAVENAGYGAQKKGSGGKNAKKADALPENETPKLLRRLIVSAILLLVLMYFSMGHMMWGFPLPSFFDGNHVAMGLLQMLLSAAILLINGKFFVSGAKGLWHRSPNMDTLVAMGSGVSFLWSVVTLFHMTDAVVHGNDASVMKDMMNLYFESAAMILVLITVGKTLEAYSKGRTTDALKGLMDLAPKTAVLEKDGKEVVVPIENVRIGDVFVVRPGENVPVDGVVLDGSGAVNESMLTGESVPEDKSAGDRVYAASVNQSGFLRCRAERVGEDTTLSQIIRMVSDASATKAPIAKIADKVSGVFVPIVIGIALFTLFLWLLIGQPFGYALTRGISVLVISCPCALGLATPVAIMVGSGVGAKNGILFKTAVSLESAGKTDVVILDKTGTITEGSPKVTDVLPCGCEEKSLLTAAYSLEKKSAHPLAKAVTEYAENLGVSAGEVENFVSLSGNGLQGVSGDSVLTAGKRAFIETVARVPDEIASKADALSQQGKTPLFFAQDDVLLGVIAVADVMKKEAPEAIRQLKNMGIRVVMLTGDNERTAAAVAKSAGVEEVIAGVLPDGKEAAVRRYKRQGRVAMVGDGINDAPALTAADVGIAIGAGADIAIDAADVVLMKSALTDVPAAIRLSRYVLRNVKQNLFWAFIYNLIGIPLAAGAFIPLFGWELQPMFGAAAMSLSSFCVVTNALRLNLVRIHSDKRDRKKTKTHEKTKQESEVNPMNETYTLKINGMMCPHCEARVKKALEAFPEVETAEVSHEKNQAVLHLQGELVHLDQMKKAVTDAGYEVVND